MAELDEIDFDALPWRHPEFEEIMSRVEPHAEADLRLVVGRHVWLQEHGAAMRGTVAALFAFWPAKRKDDDHGDG